MTIAPFVLRQRPGLAELAARFLDVEALAAARGSDEAMGQTLTALRNRVSDEVVDLNEVGMRIDHFVRRVPGAPGGLSPTLDADLVALGEQVLLEAGETLGTLQPVASATRTASGDAAALRRAVAGLSDARGALALLQDVPGGDVRGTMRVLTASPNLTLHRLRAHRLDVEAAIPRGPLPAG